MRSFKRTRVFLLGSAFALIGCVSSPRSEIVAGLQSVGLSKERASCIGKEMSNRLDNKDLQDVSRFMRDLNKSSSPGNVLDTLLTIDNPRAATALTRAGIACAF